jgi:hypothetical protein
MQEILNQLAEHFGWAAPFGYAVLAYGFFHWLDENASDEAKATLARTMTFKDYKNEQVASALVEVFDRIYTYPLLRWRAFFRSLLFTTVVLAAYMFEFQIGSFALWKHDLGTFGQYWTIAFLANVFSDYLSLFVIRPLLVRSGTKPVIGLGLGAVSGVAIVLAGNLLRTAFITPFAMSFMRDNDVWWPIRLYWQFADFKLLVVMTEILFRDYMIFSWPALAVFTWLPLFALGILIARLLTPLSWMVGRTQWFLKEGKDHPLKAIGYVAAVVIFLGTLAARAIFGS